MVKEVSEEVLRKAMEGDIKALEELYKTYSGFVYRVALGIVRNVQDAEDVTQEVFVILFKKLKEFRFNSLFSTYLYRMTINTAINHKKRAMKNLFYPLSNPPSQDDFQKKIELTELLLRIKEILPEGVWDCFYLKEVEGFKYEEISEMLGENVNTIKIRVKRAREKIIKNLKRGEK